MGAYAIFVAICIAKLISICTANQELNVLNYGAVGDGKTDDSHAFVSAWDAACKSENNDVTLNVPSQKTYLLKPAVFQGPCKASYITYNIEGAIVGPSTIAQWTSLYMGSWIVFNNINGLTVQGQGTIDGQGSIWWQTCGPDRNCSRPIGWKFNNCSNIKFVGLTVRNTPARFLVVVHSTDVLISNLKITNPENSPNTDGMDITHSKNVHVQDCTIATGDDCIAILSGCQNINITRITCGAGHGISIGSMGHNGDYDTVEDVNVWNCTFFDTLNGAHIKTWQGGTGYARRISFSDITLVKTNNPINIDQFYCPHSECANQTNAVAISDITFKSIRGTSLTDTAINLSCSDKVGCQNIVLDSINITSADPGKQVNSKCNNAHGSATHTMPNVDCLTR